MNNNLHGSFGNVEALHHEVSLNTPMRSYGANYNIPLMILGLTLTVALATTLAVTSITAGLAPVDEAVTLFMALWVQIKKNP